jgi:hypothetical protein
VVALQFGGVHPVKVVGSEIVEVHAVAEHVVGDDKDAVGHGDLGSFRSTTLTDRSELRAQVTLPGAGCCPSALQKHGPEPLTPQTQSGVIVTLSMSSLTGIARNRA